MIRTTKYDGFAGCAWALSDFDTRPGLGGIKNPVLCICGTKDATYPGMQAIDRHASRARSSSTSKAPGTSPMSSSPTHSPRRSGIS